MARLSAEECAAYRRHGHVIAALPLGDALLGPVRAVAERLRRAPPWQDMLSGVHNPYGYHACIAQAWQFLDIAESDDVLDALAGVLGPDIVLWDSELHLDGAAVHAEEARWWPVDPLAGAVVLVTLETGRMLLVDVTRLADAPAAPACADGPVYALRYLPATARFSRDPRHPANLRAAEARVLVNYARRPLWLVRGEDRAGNDFASGFVAPVAQWSDAAWPAAEPTPKGA